MGEFKKSSQAVNKLLAAATDVERRYTESYRLVDFSWKGARYRLVSTGDLYQLNYSGAPVLVWPHARTIKGEDILIVTFGEQTSGYYVCRRKIIPLKNLIWAMFGDEDLPKGHYINCKDGNYANCKIDNLEVKRHGVS